MANSKRRNYLNNREVIRISREAEIMTHKPQEVEGQEEPARIGKEK